MSYPHNTPQASPTSSSSILTQLKNNEVTAAVIGTPVYADTSTGSFKKAVGDGSSKATVSGVVLDTSIAAGGSGSILATGNITATAAQWDAVAGTTGGLVGGVAYYLSTTVPGALTTSNSSGVLVVTGVSSTVGKLGAAGGSSAAASIAAKTIGGNNTGATSAIVGLTDIQARTVMNIPFISAKDVAYAAQGDGTTDDTAALQAGINAAAAAGVPFRIPRGNYRVSHGGNYAGILYCLSIPATTGFKIIADNAVITFPSLTDNCLVFAANCADILVDGLSFQGANNDSFISNIGAAVYGYSFDQDFTVTNCTFKQCWAVVFGSDGPAPGRVICTNNHVINCLQGFSLPYRSVIANNIFDNDTQPGTRSHAIYIYGASGDVTITGNVFRRTDVTAGTYAIQYRAGAARYNYKHGINITGNTFAECGGAMWIGSDDANGVSEAVVSGNSFFNCSACVYLFGMRNAAVTGCVAEYSWEAPAAGGSAAFQSTYVSGTNNSIATSWVGNTVVNQHPYYGKVTFTTLPVAGDTITVGALTYTFRALATVTGEVTIGTTTSTAAFNFAAVIRGDSLNPPNAVLRTPQDAMVSQYTYDASPTNVVIVVSFNTFALTTSASSRIAIVAVIDHRTPISAGLIVDRTFGPRIAENTFVDLGIGMTVSDCMEPVIENNTSLGCQFSGVNNVKSTWRNNTFTLTPMREANYSRPDRWLSVTDGFPVIYGNTGADVVGQQYGDTQGGTAGLVTVGDGKAKVWFYYGVENLSGGSGQASTLAWRWDDGDKVTLSDQSTHSYSFTFKRVSPGALQFNDKTSLLALINATGWFTAAYITTTDTGGDVSPNLMIEIKNGATGTAGNLAYIQVIRYPATSGPELKSVRMCGVILLDRHQGVDATNYCYFLGGDATVTSTVVFTPVANKQHGVWVSGVDATSFALAPRVYQADITPGVGFVIRHTAAAGTEKFFVKPQ